MLSWWTMLPKHLFVSEFSSVLKVTLKITFKSNLCFYLIWKLFLVDLKLYVKHVFLMNNVAKTPIQIWVFKWFKSYTFPKIPIFRNQLVLGCRSTRRSTDKWTVKNRRVCRFEIQNASIFKLCRSTWRFMSVHR